MRGSKVKLIRYEATRRWLGAGRPDTRYAELDNGQIVWLGWARIFRDLKKRARGGEGVLPPRKGGLDD